MNNALSAFAMVKLRSIETVHLQAIVRHWDEFGPTCGFEELIARARKHLQGG